MSTAYEEAFGVRTLTGLIQAFRTTERERFFAGIFAKGKKDTVEGNTFEYDLQTLSRELAPFVGPDSPSPSTPRTTLQRYRIGLVDVKQFSFISADRLFRERGYGELVANAKAIIAGELDNLRGKIDKTKEWLAVKTLLGSVPISAANVPGTTFTDTYTWTTSTYTPGANWSNAATAISSVEVPALVDKYIQVTGMLPDKVLHNVSVEKSIIQNTELQKIAANPLYAANILEADGRSNSVANGLRLGGLNWAKSIGYYTLNGTATKFMPDNTVIVLPEDGDLPGVLGMVEAPAFIPVNAFGAEGDLGVFRKSSPGYGAYSVLTHNPAGIELHAFWRGMFYLRFPTGVLTSTVN